jgi:hypothetical protein
MRTTIRIDEELLKQAKLLAIQSGKSLTSIIEDALRQSISRQSDFSRHTQVRLITISGSGLLPGVDLDDSASLLDLMETSNDPG